MLSTQKNLNDLIKDAKITIFNRQVSSNPGFAADEEWQRTARHWRCTLKSPDGQMTVGFSQGSAIRDEPEVQDVLDCLISDASALDSGFEEWCGGLGYDSDSRKALKVYKACEKSGERLKRFLGEELFEQMRYAER